MTKLHKIITLGDKETGKTSFLLKYLRGVFPNEDNLLLGSTFENKTVKTTDGRDCMLQIWDSCKGEQDSLAMVYYRKTQCILLFVDLTNQDSFVHLNKWYDEGKKSCDEGVKFILIGTKNDVREKKVTEEEIKDFAVSHAMPYYLCSAKSYTDSIIPTIFEKIADMVVDIITNDDNDTISFSGNNQNNPEKPKRICSLL